MEALIARAIAARRSQGLSTETTGIKDRPEPFVQHHLTIAERDAYIGRCMLRGETVRIL